MLGLASGLPVGKHHAGTGDPRLDLIYGVASGCLVLFAGLMSGLTLGLMSLDTMDLEVRGCFDVGLATTVARLELHTHPTPTARHTPCASHGLQHTLPKQSQVLRRSGSVKKKRYAETIQPVRARRRG